MPDGHPRAKKTFALPTQDGFTLIELIVVLAILSLIVLIAPTTLFKTTNTAEFMADARGFASTLKEARNKAIMERRESVVYLDVDNRSFRIDENGATKTIAEDTVVKIRSARSEQIASGTGGIRFFPNGSSTGGRISFERAGKHVTVTVNWVTGEVLQITQHQERLN